MWKYRGLLEHIAWRHKLSQYMKEAFLEECDLKYETRSLWPVEETKTVYQCVY